MRRTKIFASIGPASDDRSILERILRKVDGVRINFSHGTEEEWVKRIELTRELEDKLGKYIACMGDLQGPSVRIGALKTPIKLYPGMGVVLKLAEESLNHTIPVPSPEFFETVEEKDVVLTDDGKVRLRVVEKENPYIVRAEALTDGLLEKGKVLVVRGKEYNIKSPTEKDLKCIEFAAEMDLDIIAVSYVRSPEEVNKIRGIAESCGFKGLILSKIETISAVKKLEDIIKVSDYIMVARGDLGLHFGLEVVPKLQSRIVNMALKIGKPVMIATQILESLRYSDVPTRAEVNDIYTAVREGVDSLLLTGETAAGRNPVKAVEWLNRIIRSAQTPVKVHVKAEDIRDRFVEGIVKLAEDLGARLVIYSVSGKTGFRTAKYRPYTIVYIGTPSKKNARLLNTLWNLQPLLVQAKNYTEGIRATVKLALEKGYIRKGETLIATYGLQKARRHFVELIAL